MWSGYKLFYVKYMICKHVLTSMLSFEEQKVLISIMSNLSTFSFMGHSFNVVAKKFLPDLWSQRFSSIFSCRYFV